MKLFLCGGEGGIQASEAYKKFSYVIAHIDDNNMHSRNVFTHIGFESIGNTLYKIDPDKLIAWSNS